MALKSTFMKRIADRISAQKISDQQAKAQAEEKQRLQTKAAQQEAIQAAQRAAEEKVNMLALQGARDEAYMPVLKNRLAKIKAPYTEATDQFDDVKSTLTTILGLFQSVDSNLNFFVTDKADQTAMLDWIEQTPLAFLHGSEHMSDQNKQELLALGYDVDVTPLPECLFTHHIDEQFDRLLPAARYEILIGHPQSARTPAKIIITHTDNKGAKPHLSYSEGTESPFDFTAKPNAENIDKLYDSLVSWATTATPEKADEIAQAFLDAGQTAATEEHHIRTHGHTDFMPQAGDDADTQKARLNARFAASMPHLKDSTGKLYDLLLRPENQAYFKNVTRDVKTLNGQLTENGNVLNVVVTQEKGLFSNLMIERIHPDQTFTTIPERLEIRWSKTLDRFDALITGKDTKAVAGPQEYRFDAQYHFVHQQIGQWLDQHAPELSASFKANHDIYAHPEQYRVAGYKKPVHKPA